jgi:hypothetical protein
VDIEVRLPAWTAAYTCVFAIGVEQVVGEDEPSAVSGRSMDDLGRPLVEQATGEDEALVVVETGELADGDPSLAEP